MMTEDKKKRPETNGVEKAVGGLRETGTIKLGKRAWKRQFYERMEIYTSFCQVGGCKSWKSWVAVLSGGRPG